MIKFFIEHKNSNENFNITSHQYSHDYLQALDNQCGISLLSYWGLQKKVHLPSEYWEFKINLMRIILSYGKNNDTE